MEYYSIASVSVNHSGEYRCKSSDEQTKAIKVQVLGKKKDCILIENKEKISIDAVESKS